MGKHHISAAVEAVLHSDWSADETPPGQVPHIHRPRFDGAAHSIPASRGIQTPSKEGDTTIQIWTAGYTKVLMESADSDTSTTHSLAKKNITEYPQ